MRADAFFDHAIPEDDTVPLAVRLRAIAAAKEQAAKRMEAWVKESRAREKALTRYADRMRAAAGGASRFEKQRAYLAALRRKRIEASIKTREPRLVLRTEEDDRAAREALAGLEKRGADNAAIRRLQEAQRRKFERAFNPRQFVPRPSPGPCANATAPSWTVWRPPYLGATYLSWWWRIINRVQPLLYHVERQSDGKLLNQTKLENSDTDPSDNDFGEIMMENGFTGWFQKQQAGPIELCVEVEIFAFDYGGSSQVSLSDRTGWSDSYSYQDKYLFAIMDTERQNRFLDSFSESDYTDGFWTNWAYSRPSPPNYWYYFRSQHSVPASNHIAVTIGTKNYMTMTMNDVAAVNYLETDFGIRSIRVR